MTTAVDIMADQQRVSMNLPIHSVYMSRLGFGKPSEKHLPIFFGVVYARGNIQYIVNQTVLNDK